MSAGEVLEKSSEADIARSLATDHIRVLMRMHRLTNYRETDFTVEYIMLFQYNIRMLRARMVELAILQSEPDDVKLFWVNVKKIAEGFEELQNPETFSKFFNHLRYLGEKVDFGDCLHEMYICGMQARSTIPRVRDPPYPLTDKGASSYHLRFNHCTFKNTRPPKSRLTLKK